MQYFVDKKCDLLDKKGRLVTPGYSTSQVWQYAREQIKAFSLRIKEWDYYYVGNAHFGLALTIADNSYMGLISASLLDFDKNFQQTKSKIIPLTFGKLALPPTSTAGETSYQGSKVEMQFKVDEKIRHLRCHYRNFYNGQDLIADIKLTDFPQDSMVIATPFAEDKKAFYYNQKINNMHAEGYVQCGDMSYTLGKENDMGLLDWGRGVWTRKNTWYWSSLSTVLDGGKKFGFNLGYGFGDTSAATENMVFMDGVADKLTKVEFEIPKTENGYNYLGVWRISSPDGRVDLQFTPILNRAAKMSIGVVSSDQNQVFGKFYGNITLQNGEIVTLNGAVGFAERVYNKW